MKKPESMQEAVENLGKAFNNLGQSMGVESKEAAKNLKEFTDRAEFKALVDAATQKLKDDRAKLMRYTKRQVLWLMLLVAIWITYEVWIYPILLEAVK